MDGFKFTDDIIRQAFALAYFIHGSDAEARAVVREAMGKLEVAAAAQVKRLYYSPTRRSLWQRTRAAHSRTKVSLSERHLLQRLIYVESEPYERARERNAEALRDEDLLIHFVKHLIRISLKRNSFYVALGVSRVLHNYSTNETMEIYNVVVQDPERVKDDYYYRSRKGRLLQEIKDRFDSFLNVSRVSRGEERFQTLDAPDEFVALIAECLRQFSPWHTPCAIPPQYDPTADEIPTLSSAHESEEDRVEINRIHALVHPDCYELLTTSLKFDPPALRLSVPRFNLPNGKNNMSGPNDQPRRPAPPLGASEVETLKRILAEQSARRKATHATLLSVIVDKVERARLDLETADSVSFALDDADELVEVRALDDERTLLATHLLGGADAGERIGPASFEIVLEGGQKLTFTLSSEGSEAGEESRSIMSVAYRETAWRRAASLYWRRTRRRVATTGDFAHRPRTTFIKPAFAALLLIICAGALALYVFRNPRESAPAQLSSNEQQPAVNQSRTDVATRNANDAPPTDSVPSASPAATRTTSQSATNERRDETSSRTETTRAVIAKRATTSTQSARSNTPPRQAAPERAQVASTRTNAATENSLAAETMQRGSDATRSVATTASATALSKVRKVFIEVTGERGLIEPTARLIAAGLRDGQRLAPTDTKDEADAAIKIKVSGRAQTSASQSERATRDADAEKRMVTISVRLVNEDGEVIWPANGKRRAGIYDGAVSDAAKRIVADLLKDVRQSDAQKSDAHN